METDDEERDWTGEHELVEAQDRAVNLLNLDTVLAVAADMVEEQRFDAAWRVLEEAHVRVGVPVDRIVAYARLVLKIFKLSGQLPPPWSLSPMNIAQSMLRDLTAGPDELLDALVADSLAVGGTIDESIARLTQFATSIGAAAIDKVVAARRLWMGAGAPKPALGYGYICTGCQAGLDWNTDEPVKDGARANQHVRPRYCRNCIEAEATANGVPVATVRSWHLRDGRPV